MRGFVRKGVHHSIVSGDKYLNLNLIDLLHQWLTLSSVEKSELHCRNVYFNLYQNIFWGV